MTDLIGLKPGKEIESLELNLLVKTRSLSKSEIAGLDDTLDEGEIDELITKFELRSELYHVRLYEVTNNVITSNFSWNEIPEYFLCLFYCYFGADDMTGGTVLFEKISAEALKNFLDGEAISLGFPAGTGFNQNLDKIAIACKEDRGRPADGSYKDDGVDVVGYKLFGDNRSSNLYVLLQCAAGIHWTQKKPIPINRWTQYIFWIQNNIVQSISTSEFVDKKDWQKRATTYGIIIDRLRIYNSLYSKGVDLSLRNETSNWCTARLAEGL